MSASASPHDSLAARIARLPKAELHLHMEGAMEPATVVALAARYGDTITEADVVSRYAPGDFAAFIEAYKWVTSYLRVPADYALVATCLAEQLLARNVVYAEVTLSVGVMLLRKQDAAANFRAIREAAAAFEPHGLRMNWIFDAVRQFGPEPALAVAGIATQLHGQGVVAYGMGGDELAVSTSQFVAVYEFAAAGGLRLVVHAGEIGGPESVRKAVTLLNVERIGHGIAAARDPGVVRLLIDRAIPLEICPASNLRTGALARQLGVTAPTLRDHPAPQLLRAGVAVTLSTDDPAMFDTDLDREYAGLIEMGLTTAEIIRIAENSFTAAFLPPEEKNALLRQFRERAGALGLSSESTL